MFKIYVGYDASYNYAWIGILRFVGTLFGTNGVSLGNNYGYFRTLTRSRERDVLGLDSTRYGGVIGFFYFFRGKYVRVFGYNGWSFTRLRCYGLAYNQGCIIN